MMNHCWWSLYWQSSRKLSAIIDFGFQVLNYRVGGSKVLMCSSVINVGCWRKERAHNALRETMNESLNCRSRTATLTTQPRCMRAVYRIFLFRELCATLGAYSIVHIKRSHYIKCATKFKKGRTLRMFVCIHATATFPSVASFFVKCNFKFSLFCPSLHSICVVFWNFELKHPWLWFFAFQCDPHLIARPPILFLQAIWFTCLLW